MTELTGFHHLALTVRDVEASAEWYERVLGFTVDFRETGERPACVMAYPGTHWGIGFVQHPTTGTGGFDPTAIGLDHAAFAVADRAALDAWAARLDAAGVEHSGAIDVPPGAILNFKDPDGIALALFWHRP